MDVGDEAAQRRVRQDRVLAWYDEQSAGTADVRDRAICAEGHQHPFSLCGDERREVVASTAHSITEAPSFVKDQFGGVSGNPAEEAQDASLSYWTSRGNPVGCRVWLLLSVRPPAPQFWGEPFALAPLCRAKPDCRPLCS